MAPASSCRQRVSADKVGELAFEHSHGCQPGAHPTGPGLLDGPVGVVMMAWMQYVMAWVEKQLIPLVGWDL